MTEAPDTARTGSVALTADSLAPRVGEEFVFARPEGGEARMKLVELQRRPRHALTDREPFSVTFVLKNQPTLGNGLHRLAHPALEEFEIFLSRVTAPSLQSADPAGMFYEAVFN